MNPSEIPDESGTALNSPAKPVDLSIGQLPGSLQEAAARAHWTSLMPVQARTIPGMLNRKNMMIQARTGSGKTGAFLLPMLELLDAARPVCQALVLVPTRELARQVWQEAEMLFSAQFRAVPVYGGVGYKAQIQGLKEGAHLVVGTPGRVLDHLLKKNLLLEHLRLVIFDEADRMLSMGFYPDMIKIHKYLPKRKIHGCMFSATFPYSVQNVAAEFIDNPEFISLSQDHVHVTDTTHVFYSVPGMDKDRSLIRIIEIENPAAAIIFCNTKDEVHYVNVVLQQFGYDSDELTSDLAQNQREQVLERVRHGTLRFLVATDVAARGLDIPQLSHVFQYQVPEDFESYIHRAGRTGRAGATGVAITLANEVEKFTLTRIVKRYGIDMQEWPLPTDLDVEAVVTERLTALLEARLRERDSFKTERSRRFTALGRTLADNEDESAIIAMLLDDYYQQVLHAPAFPLPEKSAAESRLEKSGRNRQKRRRR